MAQIPYRANLSAAIFPMTLARAGRSVIVPQADQNFNRSVDSPDDSNRDVGIPQIIYGENILPTADGYQSVGYKDSAGFALGVDGATNFQNIQVQIPAAGVKSTTLQFSGDKIYSRFSTGFPWTLMTVVGTALDSTSACSTGTVGDVCYLYNAGRMYTVTSSTITEITASILPAGIMTGSVGIAASYNYLILFKNVIGSPPTVHWSSTTTPTDFSPSLISGSGSGAPNGAAGRIRFGRANPAGFYVFCDGNIVSAQYTGNARYPWRFTPISNSEGVDLPISAAGDISDNPHFCITNTGTLLQIVPNECSLIGTEVSEVLERLQYKDVFNYTTNIFTIESVNLSQVYYYKITYLNSRFLMISTNRGAQGPRLPYTEVIVYDLQFKRYGKLHVTHTSIVDLGTVFAARRAILFIDETTGTCSTLEFNVNDSTVQMRGVLVLGKFQYVRSRNLILDEISLESSQLEELVPAGSRNFQVLTLPTLDGKNFQAAQSLYSVSSQTAGDVMTYYSTTEGKNISLLIKGAFDLCSVDMRFHLGGKN